MAKAITYFERTHRLALVQGAVVVVEQMWRLILREYINVDVYFRHRRVFEPSMSE